MTLWVVKGGRGGIREERFRARSIIGIGWGEVGDLSQYPDRDALRAAYRGSHPERSEGHVNTQAAQLWAFGRRMQIGDAVVVLPGGPGGKSVVAYHRKTGKVLWTALDDKTAYVSPMQVTLLGVPQFLLVSSTRLVGLSVDKRAVLWEFPWKTDHDASAAQPMT